MNGQQSQNYLFIPYSYSASSGALNHGSSVTVPLLLDQDADFELHEIFGGSSLDTATDPTFIRPLDFTFQVQDKTNGRLWSDAPMPGTVIARVPGGWRMQRPVLLARRSNLSVMFTNVTSASDGVVFYLNLLGHKVLAYTPGL